MAEIEVSFLSAHTQPTSHTPIACLPRLVLISHPWGMDFFPPKNSHRRHGIDFLRYHSAQTNRRLSSHFLGGCTNG
jgi:hypothetical protein